MKGFTEALITDLQVHAPHVSAHVVMPGHIGTKIVANSLRHATVEPTAEVAEFMIAVDQMFEEQAPMTASRQLRSFSLACSAAAGASSWATTLTNSTVGFATTPMPPTTATTSSSHLIRLILAWPGAPCPLGVRQARDVELAYQRRERGAHGCGLQQDLARRI